MENEESDHVDAVVVGGGPSGLAAALWIARYRHSVLVVDSGEHRSDAVEASHGYLGRDPQRPQELLQRGREELGAYPRTEVTTETVTRIVRRDGEPFSVELQSGRSVLAERVVLATGVKDTLPQLAGIEEHYGASVFHCPSCDGYEARDRDVVAIGWSENLVGFAGTLLSWARSVVVVTNDERFDGDEACRTTLSEHHVEVVEEGARALHGGRGELSGVELESGRVLPASLVFFSIAHRVQTHLAEELGCELDEDGHVVVDPEGETSVPRVYACGDLTPGLQLVQVAAAKGTTAGVGVAHSLFGEGGAPSSPPSAPDLPSRAEERRT